MLLDNIFIAKPNDKEIAFWMIPDLQSPNNRTPFPQ